MGTGLESSSLSLVLRESEAQRGKGLCPARDAGFLCRAFPVHTAASQGATGAILEGGNSGLGVVLGLVSNSGSVLSLVGCGAVLLGLGRAGQGRSAALTAPPAARLGPAGSPSAPTPSPRSWRLWW